jgi:hypothetical protein
MGEDSGCELTKWPGGNLELVERLICGGRGHSYDCRQLRKFHRIEAKPWMDFHCKSSRNEQGI